MKIKIYYEIHAFAEESLCDECFEKGYCIHGEEVIQVLNRKRNTVSMLEYSDSTTLKDMVEAIKEDLGTNAEPIDIFNECELRYSFVYRDERFFIGNPESNFSNVLHKYLAPNNEDTIVACILLSCDAGVVGSVHPLRFYVNSHEAGKHNSPHIHVRDVGNMYSASIRIEDGEVMVGKLPQKLAKLAKKEILSKPEYYYQCWNTLTDGLEVDIDRHLGLINY